MSYKYKICRRTCNEKSSYGHEDRKLGTEPNHLDFEQNLLNKEKGA